MAEMIDRVARAMCKSTCIGRYCEDHGKECLAWADYQRESRAAIEAMIEPTEAMIDACGNGECAKWAPGAWAVMIHEALK